MFKIKGHVDNIILVINSHLIISRESFLEYIQLCFYTNLPRHNFQSKMSKRKAEETLQRQECRKEFREQYKEQRESNRALWKDLKELGITPDIIEMTEKPECIDMESFTGTEDELRWTIERQYENGAP